MKRVKHGNKCNMKSMEHEKSATQKECNTKKKKKVQHKEKMESERYSKKMKRVP